MAEVCRGYEEFGALGHSVYHRELWPRLVNDPWEGTISHLATGGAHTAAITDSGLSCINFASEKKGKILELFVGLMN